MRKDSSIAAILVCLSLLLAAPTKSQAGSAGLSATVTNLPQIDASGFQVSGLNSRGELTGFFYVAGEHAPHAFLFSDGNLSDLGTLGGDTSQGNAINGSGHIAGAALPPGGFLPHAFIYDGGSLLDLGTLGGSSSSATLMNDSGHVAGTSYTGGDEAQQGFRYSEGALTPLGTLGGAYSTPYAINSAGAVAGQSTTDAGETHAFVFTSGVIADLGSLGGGYSSAFGLNDAGIAVGESATPSWELHAVVAVDGTMTDLGTLGGTYSSAFTINNSNQILGLSTIAGDMAYHGFLHANGSFNEIGTFGGANTFPYSLNNFGQVVGQSDTASGVPHAFLWHNGTLVDLNTLLAEDSGWELQIGVYINNAGRIVGVGNYQGLSQWFIMDLTNVTTENKAPVAVAGPNQTAECQTPVTLDGSHSFDPDGDALAFEWTASGWLLGTNPTLSGTFALGSTVVTLKVTDPSGASSQATVVVTVADTTAPVILSGPSLAPVPADANCQGPVPSVTSSIHAVDGCTPAAGLVITQDPVAGTLVGVGEHPIVVTVADASGNTVAGTLMFSVVDVTAPAILSAPSVVTVSVGANCKGVVPNVLADVLANDTCTPQNLLVKTQSPAAGSLLAKGEHPLVVSVRDAAGNVATTTVLVRMVDTTAPVIVSVTATPSTLSRGQHHHDLVPVTVSVDARDNCGGTVNSIVSITANERISRGDIQITGKLTAKLAATHNDHGKGRIYTITVRSVDSSGNSSTRTVTVSMAKKKDKGNSSHDGHGHGNK